MGHENTKNRALLMLVDDDASSRMILKQIFSGTYDTVETVNGKLALELINRGIKPDLVILDLNMPEVDGYEVLDELHQSEEFRHIPIIVATADGDYSARRRAFFLGAIDVITKPFMPESIMYRVNNILASISATKAVTESIILGEFMHPGTVDVAGIWGRQRFLDEVSRFFSENPEGEYVLARWDIDHFKLFNDNYGIAEGDRLLRAIGLRYSMLTENASVPVPIFYAHWGADHFVALYDYKNFNADQIYSYTLMQLNSCFDGFDFSISYGFFAVTDPTTSVSVMCDRAGLALSSIKDRYDRHYEWYTSEMRDRIVEELEITSSMKRALEMGEFIPYFQPQYNYGTGELIGAEALVRWNDPQKGIVSPGNFIPLFEKNGFIREVDYCMWESVCRYIRKWLDMGLNVPPISVNISRIDFYDPELLNKLKGLIEKYDITPALLHLELTESAYMDNPDQLLSTLAKLKEIGFSVEMDDFGSGYSSLNTLKDVPVDLLKLDMKFVSESYNNSRGGSILSSVIHMAHGINLPVLAEGIETRQQADYLKTINCLYMQGYLFSKPIRAEELEELLKQRGSDSAKPEIFSKSVDHSVDFLDASTQATLLFNSFLGGAAIIEFENKNILVLRSNDRFYDEIRLSRSDFDLSNGSFMQYIEPKSRKALVNAIELAVETGDETSCIVHAILALHGNREEWLQARFRNLASKFDSNILYVSISNITAETILDKALKKERIALENILHFAPGGLAEFIVQDSHLTRIYTSETAQDILGITAAPQKDENFFVQLKQIHQNDRSAVRATIQEAVANETAFSVEFRISLPNGGVRWINLSANPAKIDKVLHYFGIYTDISRHKALEIAAKANRGANALGEATSETLNTAAFRKYLASTGDFVYVKDINGNFVAVSDYFAKMTGKASFADAIGKTDFDVFSDQHIAVVNSQYDLEVLSTGTDRTGYIESMGQSEDGEIKMYRIDRYALHDAEGLTVGLYCVGIDITNDHKVEEYRLSLESAGRNLYRYVVKNRVFFDLEKEGGRIVPIAIQNGPKNAVSTGKVSPECVDKWLSLFDAIDSGSRSGTEDIKFREEDGTYTWYRITYRSVLDNNGRPSSAILSYKNVQSDHLSDLDKRIARACVFGSLATLFPAYSVCNLSRNEARPISYASKDGPEIEKPRNYDATLEEIADSCVGSSVATVKTLFSRENLINEFSAGKNMVTAIVDLRFKDGTVHTMECLAIYIKESPIEGEIFAACLLREI